MIINGIDYEKRIAELTAAGIAWDGDDDTAFGAFVYCNQHLRAHGTGWCTVGNVEKVALKAATADEATIEAGPMVDAAVERLAPRPK